MRNLINQLKDKKLHVIINEFGEVGVDGKLLSDLGVALDEINNGSILCSCRMDQFVSVLSSALKKDSETIIIEASGLTNPANLVRTLNQFKFTDYINYKGCICLVDAKRFHKVVETAVVVKKQLCASDYIIINKSDLVDEEKLNEIRRTIAIVKPDAVITTTSFGQIKMDWFSASMVESKDESIDAIQTVDITLKKYLVKINDNTSVDAFTKFVKMFLHETHRVKGFIKLENKIFYLDCVGTMFKLEEYYSGDIINNFNKIVVLSGKGLDTRKAIMDAINTYNNAELLI